MNASLEQDSADLPQEESVLAVAEGRVVKRRRATRARLLECGYAVMSSAGIDAAKIKDITDGADVGFGTFYNYFRTKDELASQVLDCLINDFGERNRKATRGLADQDPALIMPISMRLVMRDVFSDPIWQWWALRPDLLVDRMSVGFGRFGRKDMRAAIRRGIFTLGEQDVEQAWHLSVWLMVGGIHDVVIGSRDAESESFVIEIIMKMLGMSPGEAARVSHTKLPRYSKPAVDWTFAIGVGE